MLQGIGTVGGSVAVLVAALIGANTFKVWKLQKLAERKAEQAERLLTATYNIRQQLALVRDPTMSNRELDVAEESLKRADQWDGIVGGDNERRRFKIAQAYFNRLNETLDTRRALDECRPMARALFGIFVEESIALLNRQFWHLQVYVEASLDERALNDPAFREEIDRALLQGHPNPRENQMDQTINDLVKSIEDICGPSLRLEQAPIQ